MEGQIPELALYGSKNGCTRTKTASTSINEVSTGAVSLVHTGSHKFKVWNKLMSVSPPLSKNTFSFPKNGNNLWKSTHKRHKFLKNVHILQRIECTYPLVLLYCRAQWLQYFADLYDGIFLSNCWALSISVSRSTNFGTSLSSSLRGSRPEA